MPEPKRPLKVFLCHAHSDQTRVRDLYNRLTKDGVDVWLDKEKLLPGQDWELEIQKAVRESDVVIVCLSQQFNQRGFRQKEVRLALDTAMEQPEGEIFIIPARLEECENLDSLRKWHWVDLFEENGYERLIRALRTRADKLGITLQIKRTWLPNITSPRSTEKNNVNKNPIPPKKTIDLEPKLNRQIAYWIGGFTILILGIVFISSFNNRSQLVEPTAENTLPQIIFTSTHSETVQQSSTATLKPTSTIANTLTSTSTPLPFSILDPHNVPMALVMEGEFVMGSEDGENDEQSVHTVSLDAFYMDKYEVTNAFYKECVDLEVCSEPTYWSYYSGKSFAEHPVVYVKWVQADAYCKWRGGFLPTEAQWEKAARGLDSRTYPWGEGIDCNKANYRSCNNSDTQEVGSYENGKSPYGIYDMAGNVWEWTADWYDDNYYQYSILINPLGPDSGIYRVIRGGAWSYPPGDLRSSNRRSANVNEPRNVIGFRCVKDATP